MGVENEQEELVRLLGGTGTTSVHVTELAAACLRAVDARQLQLVMAASAAWRAFRDRRNALVSALASIRDPGKIAPATLHTLGALSGVPARGNRHERSGLEHGGHRQRPGDVRRAT